MSSASAQQHHDEVLDALVTVAADTNVPDGFGERVRADRGSAYQYLGVRTPDRRRRVKAGFSFTSADDDAVVAAWDGVWRLTEDEWHRRIAVVSLVHYSGKNAAFMPVDQVLTLVENCIEDRRESVHKAVGWVLRETMAANPAEVTAFLEEHVTKMPKPAIRRATERLPQAERDRLRSMLR